MTMTSKIFTTLFCCWYIIILKAQSVPEIKPLTIGDTVPPVTISNIINHSSAKINLADLKGKLVILDFWSSWCGACITLFPHLQHLQSRFGDSIAIILVNTKSNLSKDNASKINTILSNVHKRTGTKISLLVSHNNPLLDKYFPSNILPHEVWIAPDGRVTAITSSTELNETNISFLLKGETLSMRLKKDILDFKNTIPLFVHGNGGDGSTTLHRSLLSSYIEGIGTGNGYRYNSGVLTGLYLYNQSRLALVKSAYLSLGSFTRNRIRVMSSDNNFDIDPSIESATPHLYCYDLLAPLLRSQNCWTLCKMI